MTFPAPRDFQELAHELLRDNVRKKKRKNVLMSAPGSGKTYLGMRIANEGIKRGKRVAFICDRTVLVDQTSRVADEYGVPHGIIMADHWRYKPDEPFQICSAQTLRNRKVQPFDIIIPDECHIRHQSWVDLVNNTEGFAVGLSATPFTKGLGKIFDGLVHAATMHELTQKGILAPMRAYACVRPDMAGAQTADGEWTPQDAAKRGMGLVGDVVTEWLSRWPERKTIAFCPNVEHCMELCRQFNEAGVLAAVYSYKTPDEERVEMITEFEKPDSEIRVIISVEAISRGFDVRDIGCVIDCRPLRKSFSTVMQNWGRGGRSCDGKVDFIVQDHSGNCIRFADDYKEIYFNGLSALDNGEKLDSTIRKEPDKDEQARGCPKCGAMPFFKRCVACGFEKTSTSKIEHEAGVMKEMVMIGKNIAAASHADLWAQACTYARSHNATDVHKRAIGIYKNITNTFPPYEWRAESTPDVPISKATLGKIRSQQIAYAAGMRKHQSEKYKELSRKR